VCLIAQGGSRLAGIEHAVGIAPDRFIKRGPGGSDAFDIGGLCRAGLSHGVDQGRDVANRLDHRQDA